MEREKHPSAPGWLEPIMDAKGQLLPEMKLDIAFCGLISCDTKRVMECRITNRDWACCFALVQSQNFGCLSYSLYLYRICETND